MQYSTFNVRFNRGICLVSMLEVHKTQNIYFESFKVHQVVLRKCDISFCQRLSKSIYGLHKRPFYHKELNLLRNLLYLNELDRFRIDNIYCKKYTIFYHKIFHGLSFAVLHCNYLRSYLKYQTFL